MDTIGLLSSFPMRLSARFVLRIGLAIAFAWVGIMILRQPSVWLALLKPWAQHLVRPSMLVPMRTVAILDILIAVGLLFDFSLWISSLLGSVLLLGTLILTGITDVTVNYVGILCATVAAFVDAPRPSWTRKFVR